MMDLCRLSGFLLFFCSDHKYPLLIQAEFSFLYMLGSWVSAVEKWRERMPKPPTHALVWIPESASYELWTQGRREFFFQASDEAPWLAWLETHLAFSFRGQKGPLNVLKEN